MCGIVGKVTGTDTSPVRLVRAMCNRLVHRGPDEDGVFSAAGVALGSRRLKIIDLEGGRQPITTHDGRFTIVYNGEVYNFRELRDRLERKGIRFSTATDTEVVLAMFAEMGPSCLESLEGMFALAIWDRVEGSLFLARDRFGKKPLFYATTGDGLSFASEISALLADPEISRDPELDLIPAYLTYLYVPPPFTMFRQVRQLLPGHYAVWRAGELKQQRWWELKFQPKLDLKEEEAAERLRAQLERAVAKRLVADVPLGAFLSGGIDSSAVVALMAKESHDAVRTFSVEFEGWSVRSELPYARTVSQRYGTEHEEMVISAHVGELVPKLVRHFGQPFADSSAVPTYLLSQAARRHVTVALSGDGGDELFAGYDWYLKRRRQPLIRFAGVARALLRRASDGMTAGRAAAGEFADVWSDFVSPVGRHRQLVSPTARHVLSDLVEDGAYRRSAVLLAEEYQPPPKLSGLDRFFWLDHRLYLSGDILPKVDITSMANSLEVRSPLLDHAVAEFAARLVPNLKLRRSDRKRVFRRAVEDLLPPIVLNRTTKTGFGPPISAWIRGELDELTHSVLDPAALRAAELFREDRVAQLRKDHAEGRRDNGHILWALINFQIWWRMFVDGSWATEDTRAIAVTG